MPKRRSALIGALAGALALAAGAAQANPWFERCMSPDSSAAQLADSCKRALDYGGLEKREQAMAWTNMGVGYAELGRHGEALDAYDGAAKADPSYFGLYPNRALSREARGQVRGALQDYETALKMKPGDTGSLMGRGALYLKRGVPDRALADFEAILAKDPRQPDALYNAGSALIALGRTADAERMYSRLIAAAPGDASAWLQRGLARRESAPDAAAADFAKAMELDPFWPDPYVARGQLRDQQGNREGANGDFRRAFELGYQSEWLMQRVQSIGG